MKLDPKEAPPVAGPKPAARPAPARSKENWQRHTPLFLEAVLHLITQGVGIVDAAGVVRYANPGCRNIYGLEPEEIVGRHFHELYADLLSLNRMLAKLRQHGRVDNWRTEARRGDGRSVPVEITLVRLQDARDRPLGSVALIRDARQPRDLVDQLQQHELDLIRLNRYLELANLELDRANRLKDEFLANTSHELRTPLNAILGFLRLILEGLCDDPAEERHFLQNAYDSAQNLLELINELLDSARIESGKVDLQLTEVDVGPVFSRVEQLTRLQAEQKGLRLTFRQPRRRILVRADPGKLQQILLNLVTNALKFTPKGEVRVQARSLAAKGHVLIQVRDTGIGLRPEIQSTLFQKFVQGNGSSTRQYSGTGLGLAICRNLVEFMGGQIWLNSPGPGQGTTASFTLPLISPQTLYWRRLDDRERGFKIQGPARGRLIFLVEDEPRILDIMGRILRKQGYRTAFAVTADDGLEGARRLRPDLITIDMGLPVRSGGKLHSGLDLYRALQEDAFTQGIPVILVTGHDASLAQSPQALPPILTKPFRARELVQRVASRLEKD